MIETQTKIEPESLKVIEWFRNNYLKANTTKSYVDNMIKKIVESNIINNVKTVTLLGITVDSKPHLNLI